MADDINLLGSLKSEPEDQKKGPKKPPSPRDDMAMHVPSSQVPEKPASPSGFLSGMMGKAPSPAPVPKTPDDLLAQKVNPAPPPPPPPRKAPQAADIFAAPAPAPKPAPRYDAGKPIPPRPPPPAPPKPPAPGKPPKPPANGKPPARPEEPGTLRVSLISTAGGTSLSELVVRERVRAFLLVLALAIFIDGLIAVGILYYRSTVFKKIGGIEADVQGLDSQISKAEAGLQPVMEAQKYVAATHATLNDHLHWSQALDLLESDIKPNVTLSSLTGAENGHISSAMSAPDMTTIAEQLVAFRADPRIKSVHISNVTGAPATTAPAAGGQPGATVGGYATTLDMDLYPDKVFLRTASATATP